MKKQKPRGKRPGTVLKDKQTLKAILEHPDKTQQELAKEMGVHRDTIRVRLERALSNSDIQSYIQRSLDRHAMMLGKCDHIVNKILDSQDKTHFQVQLKASENIFRSFGVWKNEPSVNIQTINPIQVVIDSPEGEIVYRIGTTKASPEAGQSISKPE